MQTSREFILLELSKNSLKKFLDLNISLVPKDQIEKFSEFVKNPYFNKSQRLNKFLNFIISHFDEIENNLITRADLSEFIYPGEPYKDASIKKLISDFNKLIDKFMCFNFIESNEIERDLILLKNYGRHNYNDKFLKLYGELKNKIKIKNYDVDEFYNKMKELEREMYEMNYYNQYKDNFRNCVEMSDFHDVSFIANKLYLYQTIASISNIDSSLKFNYPFLDVIKKYIEKNKSEIILNHKEIYRNYLQLSIQLNPDNLNIYNELKSFIYDKYSGRFLVKPIIDLTNLISYIDHFSKKIKIDHNKEVIEAYKIILKDSLYQYIDVFHHYDFKRVIDCALNNNEIKFAREFYESFKNRVNINFREDMKNYANGFILYKEGYSEKALYYLLLVSNKEYHHYLTTNKLILKIYYDLGEYDKMTNLMDSYKKYFRNHPEISEAFRERNETFVKLFEKLVKLKFSNDKRIDKFDIAELNKFYVKTKGDENSYHWIGEKITELEKQAF